MTDITLKTEPLEIKLTVDPVEYAVTIARVGSQGVKGEKGDRGDVFTYTAGIAIGGHRVLTLGTDGNAYYASADNNDSRNAVVGISSGAVASGHDVTVVTAGLIDEPSWTWNPGLMVFLGLNGVLTQTPTGAFLFLLPIGFARSATQILINIQPAISLA